MDAGRDSRTHDPQFAAGLTLNPYNYVSITDLLGSGRFGRDCVFNLCSV